MRPRAPPTSVPSSGEGAAPAGRLVWPAMKALLKLLLPVALLAAVIVAAIVQSAPASLRVAGGV